MKRNKSFQLSLNKLDQVIGLPPATIYSKSTLNGAKLSFGQMPISFAIMKKSHLNRVKTPLNLSRNDSFARPKNISPDTSGLDLGLTIKELKQIYLSKCKDLDILPVAQLEKRFFDLLPKVLMNRVMNFSENRLGSNTADSISKLLRKKNSFCALNLSKNLISDKGASILMKNLVENLSIVHLDVSSNDIKADGAFDFFKSLEVQQSIISIDISSHEGLHKNRIGPMGISPLREVLLNNKVLTYLNLSDTCIGPEGLKFLIEGIQYNSTLQYLDLSKNALGGKIMTQFFAALAYSSIVSLNISSNKISYEGSHAIGEFLANQDDKNFSLIVLDISNNEINHKGAKNILSGLKQNSVLRSINLEFNPLSEISSNWLLYCFEENAYLITLNLNSCFLKHIGVQKFFEALSRNKTLKNLSLKENFLGDVGATYFSDYLRNGSHLNSIDLSNNQIGKSGVLSVFHSLKHNSSINTVILKDNLIKDDIIEIIADIIRLQPNLQVVKLENTSISNRSLNKIEGYLEKNRHIHKQELAKTLKTQVLEMAKQEFPIDQIKEQIEQKKKEELEIFMKLEINKSAVDAIKKELNDQYMEIHNKYLGFHEIRQNLSQELATAENVLMMQKLKFDRIINKMNDDITQVERDIEKYEFLQGTLIPENKRLKRTYYAEYSQLKEEKAEVDKDYKYKLSAYKTFKKRLGELRVNREKLRHPEWYTEKKSKKSDEDLRSLTLKSED